MAEVPDYFGRVGNFKNADFDSLAESLKSAVGKAVEYAAGKAKSSGDELKKETDRLVDAMEQLGEKIKENLEEVKDFVDQVKKSSEGIEKKRSSKAAGGDDLAAMAREQTRILQQILRSQQKAASEKAAKFTSGATALAAPRGRRAGLKEMGFRPKGADKIPAMLSPGEFVVNRKGTRGNESLLDSINRGYFRGGKVKPAYLADGNFLDRMFGGRGARAQASKIKLILDGPFNQKTHDEAVAWFNGLGHDVEVEFSDEFNKNLKSSAARWITSITSAFVGHDPFAVMFEGGVKDITEFRREMRNLAFQAEGITGEFRKSQAEFARIGTDIAGRTGVSVTAFQKAYLANARKGFKDQKASMKVLESGLKLSTLIGSEAQATSTLFADWHRDLGLGAGQMERMANNMQTVARRTGMTGDELVGVMKSSEQILKNLRRQGTLTNEASKNIIQSLAEFKKEGFEDVGQKMLGAMSGYSAFQGADEKTKTLLGVAASQGGVDYRDLMFGRVPQNAESMGKMAEGLKKQMADMIGVRAEDFDFEKLTEAQREKLAIGSEGTFGVQISEVEAAYKSFSKTAAGLGGSLAELEKGRSNQFATPKERQENEKKINDTLLSASMDLLGSVTANTKDQSLADAAKAIAEGKTKDAIDFKSGTKDLSAMASYMSSATKDQFGLSGTQEDMEKQIRMMSAEKQIQLRSMTAAEQLDKTMQAQGKGSKNFAGQMKAALAKGDTTKFKALADEMGAAFSESQVKDATSVDPMERLNQTITELNETFRGFMSPLVGGFIDLIGSMGLMAGVVGSMGGTLYNMMPWDVIGNIADPENGIGKILKEGMGSAFSRFGKSFKAAKSMGFGTVDATGLGIAKQIQTSLTAIFGGGPFASTMATVMRGAIGPAVLLLGAIKGVMESSEAGRTKTEGAILGAFTGGAKTGSFLTGRYGNEATAGDKALGVAGAAAWGATAGAAISVSLGGADLGLAMVLGALFAGFWEIVKIVTEGTDILQDIFKPVQVVVDYVYEVCKGIYDIFAGLFTLDIGRVFTGIFNIIGSTIMVLPRLILGVFQSIVIGIPKLILRAIGMIWMIPKAIGDSIKSALAGLVDNAWVGPIFKVLSDAFNAIYDGFMAIWTPISEIFSGIYTVFNDLGKALFGAGQGGGILSGVMWLLQKAVYSLAYVISWLLMPIKLLAYALGFVLKIVGALIKGLIYPFQYLYDVLVGHSIVPDLVFGIIKFFAMLPFRIFKALLALPLIIGNMFLNALPSVGKLVFGIIKFFSMLPFRIFKALLTLPLVIGNMFLNALPSVGKLVFGIIKFFAMLPFRIFKALLTLPLVIGNMFLNALSSVGKLVYSGLKSMFDVKAWGKWLGGIGTYVYDGFKSALQGVWDWIQSWIPGLGGASKGFGESSKQQEETRLAEGDKFSHAIGGLAGAVGSLAKGNFAEAGGKAWSSTKEAAGATWEGVKAVGSYFNPFSYFKEGTKKIEKPGLGMLHAGEMVVPANMVDKIAAMGKGAFGSIKSFVGGRAEGDKGSLISGLKDKIMGLGDVFKGCCPGEAVENANAAVEGVPEALAEALSKADDGSFLGGIKKRLSQATGYTNKFFKPLTTGFIRARKGGEGFFGSIKRGLSAQYMSMTKGGEEGPLAAGVNWLSDSIFGKKEGEQTKKGILQRISEGLFGSKGAEETKKGIFGLIKEGLFGSGDDVKKGLFGTVKSGFSWMKEKVFGQKMAEGEMGPPRPGALDKVKNMGNSLAEKAMEKLGIEAEDGIVGGAKKAAKGLYSKGKEKLFGQKVAEGEMGPPKPGLLDKAKGKAMDIYGKGKEKLFGQKVAEGEMGPPKPGLLDKAKGKAMDIYGKGKEKLFGQKVEEGEMGPPKPGLLDKAKGKAMDIYGKGKEKLFGKGPTEAVESAAKADSKASGNMESFKEKMKNIAEGVKQFSGVQVLTGALNLIPASIGLAAMIPGSYGAKMLEKLDGERLKTSLAGLADGVSSLGKAKVLLGAAAMLVVGVASLGLIPAIPMLALLGTVGPLVQGGLKALGKGLSMFGKAAANPYTWLGLALLGALNVVMIPLAYAIRLLAPSIEAFGKAIKGAFEGAGSMLKAVGESIGMILKEITISKALALGVAALGITALGVAMAAFAAGGFVASWIDYFSGDGVFNKIMDLAAMGPNLMMAADAISKLGAAFQSFAANKGGGWSEWFAGSDGVIEGFKKLSEIGTPEFMMTADAVHRFAEGMEKMQQTPGGTGSEATQASVRLDSPPAAGVEPVHLRDITGSILRDRAGSSGSKLQSDELTRMEETAYKQVEELEQIRQGINELVSLMRPKGSPVGSAGEAQPGNTKDPRRPLHAVRFGKMKYGTVGGLANRSFVNNGEV